jgi:hydroxyacylglutathione hydrolase
MKRYYFCLLFLMIACAHRVKKFDPPTTTIGSGLALQGKFLGAEFYGFEVGQSVVLFDAGVDAEGHGADELLKGFHHSRDQVSSVFLTHTHGDHTGAIELFPNALVYAAKSDAGMLDKTQKNPLLIGRVIGRSFKAKPYNLKDGLEGRQEIPLGDGTEKVIAIPFAGHTPGSYLYFFRGILFTGDAIQYKKGKLVPAPKSFHSDVKGNLRSIVGLPSLIQGLAVEQICTGHWGCTPEKSDLSGMLAALTKEAQEKLD